ncbi:MAG: ATP-binding cassette domain-containing protein [Hyphomicrobiaceae bacterium]
MSGQRIALQDVRFAYRGGRAMQFELDVAAAERLAVMGPSGSGKSTLIALIAGFEQPDAGRILIGEADVTDLPPAARPVTTIFQDNNLFAHLDVRTNVALGLSPSLRLSRAEWMRIDGALEEVGLADHGARLPREISGGEASRAAIARGLVRDRPVMLLDEPFGALGPSLRQDIIGLIVGLQKRTGTSMVIVTHDPADAAAVATHLAFLEDGRIAARGPVMDMLRGENPAVGRYLGTLGRGAA